MWESFVLAGLALGAVDTASVSASIEKPGAAWWGDFGGSVSLDSYVGTGTFIGNRSADNPYYGSLITFAPFYKLSEALTVSASLILTYEWTYFVTPCHAASGPRASGAAARDCSDTDDVLNRRGDLFDLPLGINHSQLFVAGPFTVSGGASVSLPTSRVSRATGNLFTLGGWTKGAVDLAPAYLSAQFSLAKFFPTSEARVLDQIEAENRAEGGLPVGRCASFRGASCVLLSGFVASWSMQANLSAGVNIPGVDGLSTTVTLGYWYTRRHGRDADQFTAPFTDQNGNPIVNGTNHDDSTTGTIDISYALDDHLTFSFGIFSMQPAKTADGRALRFPFYDFISPARNYSAWYLAGSYTL